MGTRKLGKVGIYSYAVTIPREIIKRLGWKKGQKVIVSRKRRSIIIKDQK